MNDWMYWSYQAIATQTTSTGTVTFKMTANERMKFLWGWIGKDDYASGRAILVQIFDADDNLIALLETEATVDNQTVAFPKFDFSISAVNDGIRFEQKIDLAKGDYIQVVWTSLLATERASVALRALIKTTKPTISIVTSAGTIPIVVDSDKVI